MKIENGSEGLRAITLDMRPVPDPRDIKAETRIEPRHTRHLPLKPWFWVRTREIRESDRT